MRRRRVLQIAALAPVVPLLPPFLSASAQQRGALVGAGLTVDAESIIGLSLSWTGQSGSPAATVAALVDDLWQPDVVVSADHGHGPDDPSGRHHSPPVLVPDAAAYRIVAHDAGDLRIHEIPSPDRRLIQLAEPTSTEPIPGLEIIDRDNWTDVPRLDTIDCPIRSSVFGLGCRADVGLRHGVVHHTVNSNSYSEADVAGLLWGIQQYHVHTRGWDDIGYNFVIDRFGRIWQAREADLFEPIASGHTIGFNAESVGVAVLGTFSTEAVPDAVVESLGLLLGWKLSLHGVDPLGHTLVRSAGGDLTEPGEMVDLRNISGHRDNQQTSCPGTKLYNRIDEVRQSAAELVPVFGHLTPTYTLNDITLDGWAISRLHPEETCDIEVIVDGGDPHILVADQAVEDLDVDYPDAGPGHGFHHVVEIDLDTASFVVQARASDGQTTNLMDLTLFATFIDVEPHRFFAPGVYFLRNKELTTGTLPGLFEPMDRVTRGQMATFLHRFMDLPESPAETPFTDLAPDAFYEAAVHWLYSTGITTGTSLTEFSPDDFVTRGQMATFLWRLCGEIPPESPNPFDDVPADAYFTEAVAWLAETAITTGISPTEFAPDDRIRRGEMATFLHRLATTPEAWVVVDPPSAVEVTPPA